MAGCFICNGPHRAKDCPKRDKLLALVTAEDKGESDLETSPRVNPLQLLNVLHVKAMVDSLATHNFVATREATRLGLELEKDTSWIKTVNSKAQKIQDFILKAKALRANDGGKGQPEMLSAIQLKNGLKQSYDTYVAALIKIKNGQSVEVPDSVVKILKEFKNVMLAELLKELPPR
ncbi:hypothetical protein CK203_037016 [Vitis vinifera]|uniref:Uncharacterized protein n=1 Tax=Vitis vinifera TaxID=29760 RepID=A0A438IUQ1_VITVI|nr:hypothetical protein CK203_037016 [Vitis vinifera]